MSGCNPHSHVQILAIKLKRLKGQFKTWRSSVSKEKERGREVLGERLDVLESLMETRGWSKPISDERGRLSDKIRSLENQNLEDIRQKAKCKLIRGGDENTK